MEEDYSEMLHSHGLKATGQRVFILDALHRMGGAADARELFESLGGAAAIHKTTVYRNLHRLEDAGIVRSFFDGKGAFRYHLTCKHGTSVHPHFVCSRCGELHCLGPVDLSSVWNLLSRQRGFLVEDADVRLTGLCRKCQQESQSPGVRSLTPPTPDTASS